jgi:hypothetical protein
MTPNFQTLDVTRNWRHIYLLESRQWWSQCTSQLDPEHDLVLTYDFGLRREALDRGAVALYVDHLVDPARMERNNLLTYEFFRGWHRDATGGDLFTHQGIPFGFAFRIEIWNDLIFQARIRASLERLRELRFQKLFVGTRSGLIEAVLQEMGIAFVTVAPDTAPGPPPYFFPIHQWMDEKVRSRKFKHQLKPFVARVLGVSRLWLRRHTGGRGYTKPTVFVQEYHPSRRILQHLQSDQRLRVVLAQYSWAPGLRKLWVEHPIPVWGSRKRFTAEAMQLMRRFREARQAKLVLEGGLDVTAGIFAAIEKRVAAQLPETLQTLNCVLRYLDHNPLSLEVMIANIGRMNTLVDCVCKARGVPSFFIINGMLAHAYLDEGKYADTINAYSSSIAGNYFRGMKNVCALGDPRMDDYALAKKLPRERTKRLTVTIGASGHNITNLSSYVAVEFEFLHDVLHALQTIAEEGTPLQVIIKVRDNGYREQYEAFTAEYFPGLVSEIHHSAPIRSILERTDFYISIYSQTLIEAACLGIPSVYYKKDTETLFAPFDGESELVTANSTAGMVTALRDFLAGHERFKAFLRRETLEKYIGPLDGQNLTRNLQRIYDSLGLPPPPPEATT